MEKNKKNEWEYNGKWYKIQFFIKKEINLVLSKNEYSPNPIEKKLVERYSVVYARLKEIEKRINVDGLMTAKVIIKNYRDGKIETTKIEKNPLLSEFKALLSEFNKMYAKLQELLSKSGAEKIIPENEDFNTFMKK